MDGWVFLPAFRLTTYHLCSVLPKLLPLVTNPDPCLRHGALHAVSEVCAALASMDTPPGTDRLSFTQYVGREITDSLLQVVPGVSLVLERVGV